MWATAASGPSCSKLSIHTNEVIRDLHPATDQGTELVRISSPTLLCPGLRHTYIHTHPCLHLLSPSPSIADGPPFSRVPQVQKLLLSSMKAHTCNPRRKDVSLAQLVPKDPCCTAGHGGTHL